MSIFKGLLATMFGNDAPAGELSKMRDRRIERDINRRAEKALRRSVRRVRRWVMIAPDHPCNGMICYGNSKSEARADLKRDIGKIPVGAEFMDVTQ